MELARLILEYLRILVWPTALVVLLVALRKPLRALLPRVTSAEVFGVKATLSEDISRLEHQAQQVKEVGRAEAARTSVQVVRVGGVSLSPVPEGGVKVDGTGDIVYSKVPDPERVLPLRNPPTYSRRYPLFRMVSDVQQYFYDVTFDVLNVLGPNYSDSTIADAHKSLKVDQLGQHMQEATGLEVWSQLGKILFDATEIADDALRTEVTPQELDHAASLCENIIDSIRNAALDTMVAKGFGVQMELGTRTLVD